MHTDNHLETIIMYGTPSCPMVPPMKGLLKQAQVTYEYINITQDSEAREHVRTINQGNESVPTFIFPDGSTLTEPSAGEMKSKLKEFGYEVPWHALLIGNIWLVFALSMGALALLRIFGVF
ncbi:MAG: glutaredoxin domain-containing protein [Anaerolineae bacterium]